VTPLDLKDATSGALVERLTDYALPESTLYAVFLPDRRLPERLLTFVQFLAERIAPLSSFWPSDFRPSQLGPAIGQGRVSAERTQQQSRIALS